MASQNLQQQINELVDQGWFVAEDHNQLTREFTLPDFATTFSFMSQIAEKAEAINHHPDWSNSYNRLRICLTTHSVGAITAKDIELATHIESLARAIPQVK